MPHVQFSEYKDLYKDIFELKREDGICELKILPGLMFHHDMGAVLRHLGNDPENEVIIITGSGQYFITPIPEEYKNQPKLPLERFPMYMNTQYPLYREGVELMMNVVHEIHVPTIGAMNGPAPAMSALALLCDITICSETTIIEEAHFPSSLVPADGNWQVIMGLVGAKRANYLGYLNKGIDADTALAWGLVNEVVPFESVNGRAWEIAREIMKTDRYCRRLTHDIFREPYRRMLQNLPMQFAAEAWANALVQSTRE